MEGINMGEGLDPGYTWQPTDDGSPNDTFIRLAMKPDGEKEPAWGYVTAEFCSRSIAWIDTEGNRVPSYPKTHFAAIETRQRKMKKPHQLIMDLGDSQYAHLYPYWRSRLKGWVHLVYEWRHYQYTTGWSMATQGFVFARWLFSEGQIDRKTFWRYWRFNLRVKRWDTLYLDNEPICQQRGK